MTEPLTPRQAEVLKLVVHEYVDSAVPVGSETLVRKFNLHLSSATIRNEMARLEEEQYITHPHTSAGRIPSDQGYRYFVESLMDAEELSAEEKATIRHQFYQASREVEDWSELAADILSRAARSLALVTAPRAARSRLKHNELIEINERTVLMVLVLQEARVRQRLLTVAEPVGQRELTDISARLNNQLSGLTAADISVAPEAPALEAAFIEAVREALEAEDAGYQAETFTNGLGNVLAQPEFSRSDQVLGVLDAVDQRNLTRAIPFQELSDGRVLVMIGSENPEDRMRDFSVVVSQYGVGDVTRGAVGVVGPTRMRYPRVISTVRYMAEVMTDLMTAVHGEERESSEIKGANEA